MTAKCTLRSLHRVTGEAYKCDKKMVLSNNRCLTAEEHAYEVAANWLTIVAEKIVALWIYYERRFA